MGNSCIIVFGGWFGSLYQCCLVGFWDCGLVCVDVVGFYVGYFWL